MSKERDIQILEHKIAELEVKIANFVKYDIDDKKRQNLEILKLKYEYQLAELELT
jgi:membrane protein insertase Oxa1/YidC/SpoIIIJ